MLPVLPPALLALADGTTFFGTGIGAIGSTVGEVVVNTAGSVRALAACGRMANDEGVEIWVAVHGPGTSEPRHIRTIMEQANHPRVGITWNSNPTDVANGSVGAAFTMLRQWIKSCHINSIFGSYPYRELFQCLKGMKYDRFTLVEIPEKLDPINGTLLLKYYKRLWQALAA